MTPDKVVDVQALCGDSVDNVPGAPGIGIKTAAPLINEYGDLDTLLARAGEIKQDKRRQTLIDFADQIRLSRQLVQLDCDTPLPAPLDDLAVREPDAETLAAFLERDGVPHPGPPGRPTARRPAAPSPRRRPPPRRHASAAEPAPTGTAPIDVNAYRLRPRPGDPRRLDRPGLRGRASSPSTPRPTRCPRPAPSLCGVSLAIGAGRGLLHPASATSTSTRRPAARAPAETWRRSRCDEALARLKPLLEDPSVLKVAPERQVRHGRPVAATASRSAPIDDTMLISYRAGGGLHKATAWTSSPSAWLDHEPITLQDRGRDRQGAEELQARRAEPGDLLRRRGRRRHPAALRAPAAAAGARAAAHRLRDAGAAAARGAGRDGAGTASRSTRTACACSPTTSPCAWPSWRPRPTRWPAGRSTSARPSRSATCCSTRWAWPGGKKTATGAWSTDASMLEELAAQGHELPRVLLDWRQLSKLKGTYTDNLVAAIDPRDRPGAHLLSRWPRRPPAGCRPTDPNLQNIPVRTEEGRKIRQAFIAEPGHVLISADYSQIELRLLAHIGDIPQLKQAFERGPRHPRHDRVGDVRRAGRGHAGRDPPARQGDQLRHRLRHLGLRPGQPALDPARGGRGLHQDLLRALPRHPRPTWTACSARCAPRASSPPSSAARSTSRRPRASRRPSGRSATARRSTPRSRAPPPT